jgi:hypothetical protein
LCEYAKEARNFLPQEGVAPPRQYNVSKVASYFPPRGKGRAERDVSRPAEVPAPKARGGERPGHPWLRLIALLVVVEYGLIYKTKMA